MAGFERQRRARRPVRLTSCGCVVDGFVGQSRRVFFFLNFDTAVVASPFQVPTRVLLRPYSSLS